MKKIFTLLFVFLCVSHHFNAQNLDTLKVYYYENYPYAYTEKGEIKGIELEIMDEFITWMAQKKNTKVLITKRQFLDFNAFYNDLKTAGPKIIGMGSVTDNAERAKDVVFSPAYLKNIAVLVSDGNVVSAKTKEEGKLIFGNMDAMVVKNSSHEKYLNDIKTSFLPELKITYTESQTNVLNAIVADKKNFGFVDIVAYWSYLKKNPNKFLKIQKAYNAPSEMLGFVMPKNSIYAKYINEFFESGFGFTATKKYHQILEKYLGHEIIDAVEIK